MRREIVVRNGGANAAAGAAAAAGGADRRRGQRATQRCVCLQLDRQSCVRVFLTRPCCCLRPQCSTSSSMICVPTSRRTTSPRHRQRTRPTFSGWPIRYGVAVVPVAIAATAPFSRTIQPLCLNVWPRARRASCSRMPTCSTRSAGRVATPSSQGGGLIRPRCGTSLVSSRACPALRARKSESDTEDSRWADRGTQMTSAASAWGRTRGPASGLAATAPGAASRSTSSDTATSRSVCCQSAAGHWDVARHLV